MGYTKLEDQFPLGIILANSNVVELDVDMYPFLRRHHTGDWGDLSAEDKAANDHAVANGGRILSKYHAALPSGGEVAFYIITESDRSVTTVLLCEDY